MREVSEVIYMARFIEHPMIIHDSDSRQDTVRNIPKGVMVSREGWKSVLSRPHLIN